MNKIRTRMLQTLNCLELIYFVRNTFTSINYFLVKSNFQLNETKQLTFVRFCCVQILLLFSGFKTSVRLLTQKTFVDSKSNVSGASRKRNLSN